MNSPQPVAVLCVAPKSVYYSIPHTVCYDIHRDARSFQGDMPIVAHPPCRSWSAFCRHQAKPTPGEKELGPLCVDWLKKCGGILEHPAHSTLFNHANLPLPNQSLQNLWTIEVLQAWWGDTRTKKTWLRFSNIPKTSVHIPIKLHNPQGDRRRWQLLNSTSRSATHPNMANWLVNTARLAWKQ